MLLLDTITGTCLTDMVNVRLLADDLADGVLCHRLDCEYPPRKLTPEVEEIERQQEEKLRREYPDMPPRPRLLQQGPVTVWITKHKLLLRRLSHWVKLDTHGTESETTYEPAMDVAISEEELRFIGPKTEWRQM